MVLQVVFVRIRLIPLALNLLRRRIKLVSAIDDARDARTYRDTGT